MSDLSQIPTDQLLSMLQQNGGDSMPLPQATPQPPSLVSKFGMGLGDSMLGLWQTIANMPVAGAMGPEGALIAGNPSVQDLDTMKANDANQFMANRESDWQAKRAASGDTGVEWARLAGAMTGSAPLMALAPETGPGFMPGLIGGAAQGGIASLAQPVTNGNYGTSKLSQLGFGTGLGGILGGILGLIGKPAQQQQPDKYRDAVNFLRDRDVQPTIGQTIGPNAATREDMMSAVNFNVPGAQRRALETFNQGALNEALQPMGLQYTGPGGREGMANVADVFDRAYSNIKGQISLPITDQLRTNIGDIVSNAATPDVSIAKTTQNILDKALYAKVDQNGVLSGDMFKAAESDLGKYAQRYTGGNATATERAVGEALQGVQGALRDSLEEANPVHAQALRNINRGYAILARIQNAVPTNDADGLVTPFSLARAVRAGDTTVRDRAYTEGDALLQNYSDAGLRVLGNRFPNSGTAGRMLSADPFAWPFQIGASLAAKPFYSPTGGAAAATVMNMVRQVPPALRPFAQGAQQAVPYALPGLMGLVGPQ